MADPWLTLGLPMVVLWLTHGCPMAYPWLSQSCPMAVPWLSHAYPWLSHGLPMSVPWLTHGLPMAVPWLSHGGPMAVSGSSQGCLMAVLWRFHGCSMVVPAPQPTHLYTVCACTVIRLGSQYLVVHKQHWNIVWSLDTPFIVPLDGGTTRDWSLNWSLRHHWTDPKDSVAAYGCNN